MSNCLCCGKAIEENEAEENMGWHKKCIKKFFNTKTMPLVELSQSSIEKLAKTSVKSGITTTGVQKKLSFHLSNDKEIPRLTLVNFPSGYILKPLSLEYEKIPEAEHLVMSMAESINISTVPHALIMLSDKTYAYITKRIDRNNNHKIAMEDFCQLSERLTEDKYKGSYEQCAKIIKKYSAQPGLDLSEFFYRLVFCFITGNSDMHLKNFSLIDTLNSNTWTLSPAYDLLPVNIVSSFDTEETALTLNAKKNKLSKNDFLDFAQAIKISKTAAEKMITNLLTKKEQFIDAIHDSLITNEQKKDFVALVNYRCSKLS